MAIEEFASKVYLEPTTVGGLGEIQYMMNDDTDAFIESLRVKLGFADGSSRFKPSVTYTMSEEAIQGLTGIRYEPTENPIQGYYYAVMAMTYGDTSSSSMWDYIEPSTVLEMSIFAELANNSNLDIVFITSVVPFQEWYQGLNDNGGEPISALNAFALRLQTEEYDDGISVDPAIDQIVNYLNVVPLYPNIHEDMKFDPYGAIDLYNWALGIIDNFDFEPDIMLIAEPEDMPTIETLELSPKTLEGVTLYHMAIFHYINASGNTRVEILQLREDNDYSAWFNVYEGMDWIDVIYMATNVPYDEFEQSLYDNNGEPITYWEAYSVRIANRDWYDNMDGGDDGGDTGPIVPVIPDDHEKPETIIIPDNIDNMNISYLRAVHERDQTIHNVEVINAVIIEQINSQYTLEFDLVNIEDVHYVEGSYLFFVDNQYFRVAKTSKTHGASLTITVDCEHISYDLQDDLYPLPFEEGTEFEASPMQLLEYAMMYSPFQITGDASGFYDATYMKPSARTIRDLIFEMANFIGCEVIFDNFWVVLLDKRGTWYEEVAEFRLGSNLLSVTEQIEYENRSPRKSLEVDVVDLASLDQFNGLVGEGAYEMQLGDLVRITDPIISVDDALRIVHIERDPFKRMLPKVQIGSVIKSLTDYERPEEEEEEQEVTTDIAKYFSEFKIGDVDMMPVASDDKDNVIQNWNESEIEAEAVHYVDRAESLRGVFATLKPEYENMYLYLFDAYFGKDGSATMYRDTYYENVNDYGAHEWELPFERDDRDSMILVLMDVDRWSIDESELEQHILGAYGVTLKVGSEQEEEGTSGGAGPSFIRAMPESNDVMMESLRTYSSANYQARWNWYDYNDGEENPDPAQWYWVRFEYMDSAKDANNWYNSIEASTDEMIQFNSTIMFNFETDAEIEVVAGLALNTSENEYSVMERHFDREAGYPPLVKYNVKAGMNHVVFQTYLYPHYYEPAPAMMPMSLANPNVPPQTYDTSDVQTNLYTIYLFVRMPNEPNTGAYFNSSVIGNRLKLVNVEYDIEN